MSDSGYTLADLLRLREETKPYDFDPGLRPGDPVGWADAKGVVHIETFKGLGPNGLEVEPDGRNIAGALAAFVAIGLAFVQQGGPAT
jgi:hypothetical protein